MKYCPKCGKAVEDYAVVCDQCGESLAPAPAPQQQTNDAPSMGFAILGFFFPLIGLILWLVWKDSTPLKAKSAGKGALVGVIVSVALSIISSVLAGIFVALAAAAV